MIPHSVVLTIEGPQDNNHHLELFVFAEKIAQFNRLLATSIKNDNHSGVVVKVVHLRHASPAIVECQPTMNTAPHIPTVRNLEKKLACVESGNADQVDSAVLSAMKNLARINPQKIAWGEITIIGENPEDRRVFRLGEQLIPKPESKRGAEYAETSTIDGVLKEINIRSRPYTCKIYDAGFPPATIKCEFPDDLLEQVQGALGSGVFASGDFFYKSDTSAPYKIRLNEIEVLPSSGELPSLSDLEGIAPGLTGNKTAEGFVRELRNQWNKNKQ